MTPAQRATLFRRRNNLDAQVQALFAGGKVGGMWDFGDTSTLYQQSPAGVTAFDVVTTAGQQIGTVIDKSKKSTWTDNTGSTWTKSSGDGVVTVVGNVITITGATTTTRVDRVGGTIPLAPGVAVFDVTAAWSTATGAIIWCRGAPQPGLNGSSQKVVSGLNSSSLERVQIDTGTATFTINSLRYLEGNHATQSTAGSRPLYQVNSSSGCARFDGVNDILTSSSIDFSAATTLLFSMAFQANSAAQAIALELGADAAANNGAFYFCLNQGGGGLHQVLARATTNYDVVRTSSALSSVKAVLTAYIDLSQSAASSKFQTVVNGSSGGTTVTTDNADTAANFITAALNIGARTGGSLPASMDLFALAVRGGSATAQDIATIDAWARSKVGL